MSGFLDVDLARAARLREERKRLGFIQKGIAEKVGLNELTWVNYEKARRVPDQRLLEELHKLGFDIFYLVTGDRKTSDLLSQSEQELFRLFHQVPESEHSALLKMVRAFAISSSSDS